MSTLGIILSVILAILGLLLIVMILMQSNRSAGLGAVGGGGSGNDSYWSKNKGNSMEGALERYTKIGGGLFMVLALIINFVH